MVTRTVSGSIASFLSPTKANIRSMKAYFSFIQNGTGEPSLTNIRPIVGRTGMNVYTAGRNIRDDLTISDGYYDASGTARSSNSTRKVDDYVPTTSGAKYIIRGVTTEGAKIRVHEYDANKDWIRQVYVSDDIAIGTDFSYSWISSSDAKYFRCSFPKCESGAGAMSLYADADVKTVSWVSNTGAKHGGYFDLVTGELVLTHAYIKPSSFWKNGSWTEKASVGFSININVGKNVSGLYITSNVARTANTNVLAPGVLTVYLYYNGTGLYGLIWGDLSDFTDWKDMRDKLLACNAEFVYPLKNNVVYQLTGQQLKTLVGRNNVWNDSGDIEVTYDLYETNEIMQCRKRILMNTPHIETISESMASFKTDMTSSLVSGKIYFEPIQDTHGIAPMPAGYSKNLFIREDGKYHTTSTSYLYFTSSAETMQPGTYYLGVYGHPDDVNVTKGLYVKVNGATAVRIGSNFSAKYAFRQYVVEEEASIQFYLYSSSLKNAKNGFRFMLSTSELTGDPEEYEPYSNICPIYGRTSLDVVQAKKNLCDSSASLVSNPISNTGNDGLGLYLPAGTYTAIPSVYSPSSGKAYSYLRGYVIHPDGANDMYYAFSGEAPDSYTAQTFTLKNGDWLFMYEASAASSPSLIQAAKVQVELGNTATEYEEYAGITNHISFPVEAETVYGGYLDLVSWTLTVTYGKKIVNNLTSWAQINSGNKKYFRTNSALSGAKPGRVFCNILQNTMITTDTPGVIGIYIQESNGRLAIRPPGFADMDVTAFRAWLSDTAEAIGGDIELIYPLEEPVTYSLDPATINTLKGLNNIYSYASTTEVSYWTH